MSDPVIQEIKSRIDIVPFIQGYVKLNRAGVNFKGLCPFHSEKTPSFMVSPTRQSWRCFGCSKGGDIFAFLMEIDHIEFGEALRVLADKAGVQLVREDPRLRSERDRLYQVTEEAAKFYETQFKRTPAVSGYLKGRGLKPETITEFRIGYAPEMWDALTNHLKSKGFSEAEMVFAGLSIKSERRANSYYDRFRNRVMFPIFDANGKVIGFGGRIFERGRKTDEPKYVNSPQSPIYDKSRVLYGFDKAKEEIRRKNRCVVVEGYVDLIMSHQAGIREAVAISGTAMTAKHLERIKQLTDTLIASFDTDQAGENATRRSLDLAADFDFNRKVALIPKGKDPADAILENPQVWEAAVEESKSLMDFYLERALKKFNLRTPESKKEFSRFLLPEVAKMANEIEKAHWISKIAQLLGVKEESVWAELLRHRVRLDEPAASLVESVLPGKQKLQKLEERILGALFLYPEARDLLKDRDISLVFVSDSHREIFRIVGEADPSEGFTALLGRLPAELKAYIDAIVFEVEAVYGNIRDHVDEIKASIREVERERLKEKLTTLAESIGEAERASNLQELDLLLKDFQKATENLTRLSDTPAARL